MRITDSFPSNDGFYMPAEFETHRGTIMIWPYRPGSWPYEAKAARKVFAEIIANLLAVENVYLLCRKEDMENAKTTVAEAVKEVKVTNPYELKLFEIDSDDAWARDTAPTFLINGLGDVRGINWSFNAWGGEVDGLYANWEKDDLLAEEFCNQADYDYYDAKPFVLEGGSIHTDGEGTLIVTESCLLSEGRNPSMTKEEIESTLKDYLDVRKVIWLPYGIYNDETNEHVDNVCAFSEPGQVLLAWTDDKNDPQYEMSLADYNVLKNETDARGRHFNIRKLYIPKEPVCIKAEELEGYEFEEGEDVREEGERLAASYANFYVANDLVLMPAFGDVNDDKAKKVLEEAFPDRKVVPIYARDIIVGGGNIHCITQQLPI